MDDPRARDAFFALHDGLPREGPGDRASLRRALAATGLDSDDGKPLRVLDLGCGPGLQTLALAELLPAASILAVDTHAPFLVALGRRAAAAGVGERVRTLQADMASLDLPASSFDLIWCEGAAYIIGFARAIASWRPLLGPGGRMAITEAVWLAAEVPDRLRSFWSAYPEMTDVEGCLARIDAAGMEILDHFVLPEKAWWDDYYLPLKRRIEELRPRYDDDPVGRAVLREHEEEIAMYREFSELYGYAFFVMAARR